jgi:hypothetical protein
VPVPLCQSKAWLTYSVVAKELLPLLDIDEDDGHSAVGVRLDALAVQIRQYASLWSDHGDMLRAAVASAIRLHGDRDRAGLVAVLRLIAARLFLLSTSRRPAHRAGHGNERAWDSRFSL